ncbi:MAG: PAS domain-containing protein [Woeseiaceae bacterium]|nr:PAS domain-containing protein [Woeseiaceae bacterium]
MSAAINYQWLFRRAPIMATSIGEDGCYLDVNDVFTGRLGYRREEFIGERPARFVTKDSAERIDKEFRPVLRRTGKLENKPVAFVAKNGEVINCLTNSVHENDPDGTAVRTISMYTEVTVQARADMKYRQLYRSYTGDAAYSRCVRFHCHRDGSLAEEDGLRPRRSGRPFDHGFFY